MYGMPARPELVEAQVVDQDDEQVGPVGRVTLWHAGSLARRPPAACAGVPASLRVDLNPMSTVVGTSIQTDVEHLHQHGYVVVPGLLSGGLIQRIKAELAPYLRGTLRGRNDFEGFETERVYALLAKAPVIAELVEHPRILPIVDRLLAANYLLSANLAIQLHPGETRQPLHFDDGFYKVARPRRAFGISTIWAIDEFTAENGATEIIPGSHLWGDERPAEDDPRIESVLMPAGSVVVFMGTLWHRGGANGVPHPPGHHPPVLRGVAAADREPGARGSARDGGAVLPACPGAPRLRHSPAVHGLRRRHAPAPAHRVVRGVTTLARAGRVERLSSARSRPRSRTTRTRRARRRGCG